MVGRKPEKKVLYNHKYISARHLRRMKGRTRSFASARSESCSTASGRTSSSSNLTSSVHYSPPAYSRTEAADVSPVCSDKYSNSAKDVHVNSGDGSLASGSFGTSVSNISEESSIASSSLPASTPGDTFLSDFRALLNDHPAIPGTVITRMLKLLNKHQKTICDEKIPNSSRTLLGTPRTSFVQRVGKKETFFYFGIEATLKKYTCFFVRGDTIKLGVFIDGVEGDKSTGLVHWPILGQVLDIPDNLIIPIALFTGYSKPDCLEMYLRQFVDEVNHLYLNGLVLIDNTLHAFKLVRILGDAPARCFFLNTVSHNAFHHCTYCEISGRRLFNRNYFYEPVPSNERTNDDFQNLRYSKLQRGYTPLMDILDFNILEGCPYDPMHMMMRILKNMLSFMTLPERNSFRRRRAQVYRLRPITVKVISMHLRRLRRHIPVEFQRKTDGLENSKRWKAVQCRFFILVRLLSMQHITETQMNEAHDYLQAFVHSYAEIYGMEAVSHYVHGLLHLVQQVRKHGALDTFAAYLCESYMSTFKLFKHSARSPAQQVVNRILERQVASRDLHRRNKRLERFPKAEYNDGAFPPQLKTNDYRMYSQIRMNSCTIIANRDADNVVQLKSGSIFRVRNILVSRRNDEEIFLYGYPLPNRDDAYSYPGLSSSVGIYEVIDDNSAKHFMQMHRLTDFDRKCINLPLDNNIVQVQCLLHH